MMEKMIALQQKRRSKKGGFTLVELIVVLVILAILAALLIPALTGYIDKAREKQVVAECRQAVMAAQTLYDEAYGTGVKATVDKTLTFDNYKAKVDKDLSKTLELAELTNKGTLSNITVTDGKIATLTWTSKTHTKPCTYADGNYTVAD